MAPVPSGLMTHGPFAGDWGVGDSVEDADGAIGVGWAGGGFLFADGPCSVVSEGLAGVGDEDVGVE